VERGVFVQLRKPKMYSTKGKTSLMGRKERVLRIAGEGPADTNFRRSHPRNREGGEYRNKNEDVRCKN